MAKVSEWKQAGVLTLAVLLIAGLNFGTYRLMQLTGIPFFLDTWATTLGVLVWGLPIGMAGAIIHNLLVGFTGSGHWIWVLSSLWVATSAWYFFRKGWIDIKRPAETFVSGMLIGLSNAVLVLLITLAFFGGVSTYEPTEGMYDRVYESTGSTVFATIGVSLITEIADKTISVFIAALLAAYFPGIYRLRKR